MSDLISRQAAISAICNACGKIDCDKMDKCEKLQLPPANCSEIPNNSDTISRQAAIDIVRFECGEWEGLAKTIIKRFEQLPSAQPEIIHCRECKHHRQDNHGLFYCSRKEYGYGWGLNDFCSDAERRTDE